MSDRLIVPSGMSRRHFLGHMATTALAVPAMQFFGALEANAQQLRKQNKSCILLWMGGGPSHMDTWDLKPESEKNGGPFKPIATSAAGVKISEHLPNVAKQMKHLNIIRSLDSKEGNHDRGTYMMHTGYAPNPTVVHPSFGSVCSYELGEKLENFDLPHCISINTPGPGRGLPRDGALAVRGAEPERPDRQPPAPRGRRRRRGWAAGSQMLAHGRGRTSSRQRRGQAAVDHKAVYAKTSG